MRRRQLADAMPDAAQRTAPVKGSFDDFIAHVLARESGIDPARFDWYALAFDIPALRYPPVSSPGRGIRLRETGRLVFKPVTVAEYFDALGVLQLFDPGDPSCIEAMQCASTNALGFVGFQFGERALIEAGYYRPRRVRIVNRRGLAETVDSYYVGAIRETAWRNGRTERLYHVPGTQTTILATDVNRWDGTFTGKHGIQTIADLKDPSKQHRVMKGFIEQNYRHLQAIFKRHAFTVRRAGQWSGLLAAAHLCGCEATARFALTRVDAVDEFGTSIHTYYDQFAGYRTPYA